MTDNTTTDAPAKATRVTKPKFTIDHEHQTVAAPDGTTFTTSNLPDQVFAALALKGLAAHLQKSADPEDAHAALVNGEIPDAPKPVAEKPAKPEKPAKDDPNTLVLADALYVIGGGQKGRGNGHRKDAAYGAALEKARAQMAAGAV